MRAAHFLVACMSVPALSGRALSQAATKLHPVTVQIIDSATHQPVFGAEVVTQKSGGPQTTPRTGLLRFEILPNGDTLKVRRLGYRPVAIPVSSLPDKSYVTIGLVAIPRTLEDITIEARMGAILSDVGFFERRKRLSGFFMDPSEMAEMHPSRPSDIFERAPGAKLSAAASGGRNLRFARAQNCAPIVYVDGVLLINEPEVYRVAKVRAGITRTSETANDIFGQQDQGIDEIGVRQIAAVEAYPTATQAPPPYNGTGSNCGVVLFWTWSSVNNDH